MLKDFYKTITKPKVVLSLLAILILHILGVEFGLYKSTNWYDIPMHFFGGAWTAFFLANWPDFNQTPKTKRQKFVPLIIFVMSIGIAWELYELSFDTYFQLRPKIVTDVVYIVDTIKDLLMDFIGGAAFYHFKYARAGT